MEQFFEKFYLCSFEKTTSLAVVEIRENREKCVRKKVKIASSKKRDGGFGGCKPPNGVWDEAPEDFTLFCNLILIWANLGASELDIDRIYCLNYVIEWGEDKMSLDNMSQIKLHWTNASQTKYLVGIFS